MIHPISLNQWHNMDKMDSGDEKLPSQNPSREPSKDVSMDPEKEEELLNFSKSNSNLGSPISEKDTLRKMFVKINFWFPQSLTQKKKNRVKASPGARSNEPRGGQQAFSRQTRHVVATLVQLRDAVDQHTRKSDLTFTLSIIIYMIAFFSFFFCFLFFRKIAIYCLAEKHKYSNKTQKHKTKITTKGS